MSSPLGVPGLPQLDEIGRGEHGTVFRADEAELGRPVAVKVFRDRVEDDETQRAFVQECQVLSRLPDHPNIVKVHRGGVTDLGEPYLVMDLVEAGSVGDRLRRDGPLSWPEVLRIGVALAAALETAHRAGVLHLSVTPTNVLVNEHGEPRLTDFGIAGLPGVTATSDERIRASIAYTAPERLLDGAATPSADLYGLGSTMYTLLAGKPAVTTKAGEDLLVAIARVVRQPVPELRGLGVPDPVTRMVERLLAKSPVDRFATAADAVRAVQAAQRATGKPVTEAVIGNPGPARPSRHRPRRPPVPDDDELADEQPLTHPRYVPRTRPGRSASVAAIPTPRTSAGSAASATLPVRTVPSRAPRSTPDALTAPIPTGFPIPRREPAAESPARSGSADETPDHASPPHTAAPTAGAGAAAARRTAPKHAAAVGTSSASATFAQSARHPLVLATAGVALVGLALGAAQWLSRPAASPPAVTTSATSAPPAVAPATVAPVPAPTAGGAGRQIAVADGITHPALDAVADRFDGYFRALNEKVYEAAFGNFSPDSAVARNGLAAFRKINSTTEVQRQRIVAIDDLPAERLLVTVTYRSTQDARFGPNGAPCADWRLAYELTGPDRLIRRARLLTDPKPC